MYRDWKMWNDEKIYFSGVWCIYILELFACADAFFAPCICTDLIFAVADAFVATVVSAIPWYSLLQILFFRPIYLHLSLFMTCRCFSACLSCLNCIYILPFLGLKDTSFANFSSASHVFYDLQMLLIEIMHPLLALSITCRYSPLKFCIFNLRKSTIADISTKIISTTPTKQSLAL